MEEHLICLLYLKYIFSLLETNTQKITIFASLLSSSSHNKRVKTLFFNKKKTNKQKKESFYCTGQLKHLITELPKAEA